MPSFFMYIYFGSVCLVRYRSPALILFRLRLNRANSQSELASKSTEKIKWGCAGFHYVFLYKNFNHLVICGMSANFYVSYDTNKFIPEMIYYIS